MTAPTPISAELSTTSWFAKMFNPSNGEVSLRHVVFFLFILASIAWLSFELVKRPMGETWFLVYGVFATAATVGKVVGASQAAKAISAGDPNVPKE